VTSSRKKLLMFMRTGAYRHRATEASEQPAPKERSEKDPPGVAWSAKVIPAFWRGGGEIHSVTAAAKREGLLGSGSTLKERF